MKVLKYPDAFLFKKVEKVIDFNQELQSNAIEMLKIMKENDGVGLAANQVGLNKRIFVMQCDYNKEPYVFINPIIKNMSENQSSYQEGCLSFPKLYIELERSQNVTLGWQNLEGLYIEETFSDLEAICIQHEIEHLDGIVFINKLKPLRKQFVLKKYMKLK